MTVLDGGCQTVAPIPTTLGDALEHFRTEKPVLMPDPKDSEIRAQRGRITKLEADLESEKRAHEMTRGQLRKEEGRTRALLDVIELYIDRSVR